MQLSKICDRHYNVSCTKAASRYPRPEWGICSRHCGMKQMSSSDTMMEAKLNIMSQAECGRLGRQSQANVDIEICAARKNSRKMKTVVYKVNPGQSSSSHVAKLISTEQEQVDYYGGADACQGDSGGPL